MGMLSSMGFLAPVALSLAALSIPIVILYLLKLRREERPISSTLLWQQILRDREANAPWQRLRRNLLLLVQLLLLFLLVMALARPFSEISRAAQGNVVVLLDASASMQATDLSPSRFEAARDRVRQLIDGLGKNDTMTLIAVADTPRVLSSVTRDRSILRQALAGAQVSHAEANWEAAFVLAMASAQQSGESTTVLFSDGGLPAGLPALPGQVRYVPIGVSAENRAVSALAIRDGPQGPQAFVRVTNAGTQPATALVQVYADGGLVDARTLSLEARGEVSFSLEELPLDTRQVEARLSEQDALALDDAAWAVRGEEEQSTVVLVTPGNAFLERALQLQPHLNPVTVQVTETLTQAISAPGPTSLYVFDGVLATELPAAGNLLVIDPPTSTELFEVTGTLTRTQISLVTYDDALLQYVDLEGVHVARARAVEPPSWARTLVQAEGGPLLLAGEVGGRRVAIVTFDLHHSDLPLQIAFPILMSNLTRWLAPTSMVDVPLTLRPGMPVTIRPQVDVTEVAVTSPSGRRWVYAVEGQEAIPFAETEEPGVYRVEQQAGEVYWRDAFAVNLFSELESRIEPQDEIEVGISPVRGQVARSVGRREWWRWLAVAGLGVSVVEWGLYWRGKGRRGRIAKGE